jgi:hypothetical protein
MPTHDYIIANGTGAAVRADINLALSAIVSLNSSASEPGTMYAYQLWADTGSNPSLLKIRNGANSGWITLRQLDGDFSIVAVEDGLQATPSLTFTNDLNTGVFRSGADALAIVTGGQYAIACTSTQAVGIKTANPSTALHVAGNARVGADDVTDAHLQIGKGATGNRNSYIDIVGDTTYTDYGLRVIRNNTGANATSELKHRGTGALNFTTEEAAPIVFNTTNSPALTITSGGLVGIGTSSPWTRTEIRSANVADGVAANTFATPPANLFVGSNSGFALNDGGSIALGGNRDSGSVYSAYGAISGRRSSALGYIYDGYLAFSTAASDTLQERMRITSAGLVGIGNTTGLGGTLGVSGHISLSGNGTGARYLALLGETSTYAGSYVLQAGGGSASYGGAITMYGNSHATYPGSVYIGTSASSGGSIIFGTENAVAPANEKARIDSSGRLLVGTTTSITALTKTIELHGAGDGTGVPAYQIYAYPGTANASAGHFDFFRSASSTLDANTLVGIDDRLGQTRFFGADGSTYIEAARIAAEVDGTVGANRMPGRLVFSTATDASPSVLTERMRITSAGNLLIGGTLPSSPNAEIKSSGLITSGGYPITRSFSFLKYSGYGFVSQVLNIDTEINAQLLTGSTGWRQATVTLRGFDGGSVGYWHGIYSKDDGGVRATELASTGDVTLTVSGGNLTFTGSLVGQWYNTVLTISYTAI